MFSFYLYIYNDMHKQYKNNNCGLLLMLQCTSHKKEKGLHTADFILSSAFKFVVGVITTGIVLI